ncbi:hypothetical protein DFH28DRAFT_827946, partial [Melampsora americana]
NNESNLITPSNTTTTPTSTSTSTSTNPTTNHINPNNNNTNPNPNPALPISSASIQSNANQDQERINNSSSSTNSTLITPSSFLNSPQTIPIDPSSIERSSSTTSTSDKNSLPIIFIIFISILLSLFGLLLIYKLSKKVYDKFQRFHNNEPPIHSNRIDSNHLNSDHYDDHHSNFQSINRFDSNSRSLNTYYSKASLARHSIYHSTSLNSKHQQHHQQHRLFEEKMNENAHHEIIRSTFENQQNPSISSLLPSHEEHQQNSRMIRDHSISSLLASDVENHQSSRMIGSWNETRRSSIGLNFNPLLFTQDHSTLSTETLKQATSFQSRNRKSEIGVGYSQSSRSIHRNSFYGVQDPSISRVGGGKSRIGLPHLTKVRSQLILPTPLSKPKEEGRETDHRGVDDRSMGFFNGSSDGIGFDEVEEEEEEEEDENDPHFGSIPLHTQFRSYSNSSSSSNLNSNSN